jgi:hypothetical protein
VLHGQPWNSTAPGIWTLPLRIVPDGSRTGRHPAGARRIGPSGRPNTEQHPTRGPVPGHPSRVLAGTPHPEDG